MHPTFKSVSAVAVSKLGYSNLMLIELGATINRRVADAGTAVSDLQHCSICLPTRVCTNTWRSRHSQASMS